ncbi:hypothetical protein LIA77_01414 [Sarocladium implicatum]|nr:hypothetical protein LIA77_01414 [Sarocladium implicatum]
MFSTKSAQSLKNLFAGYHEPPTLSRQHSQKLLDGLKASFRSQLDREHGHVASNPTTPSKTQAADAISRRSPAHQHLKTILTNPLFSYERNPTKISEQPASKMKRDPMDVFEEASSKNMMTIQAATGCLVAKNKLLAQPASASTTNAEETAERVLRWLQSSSHMKDMQFLSNYRFVQALMPSLVDSGKDEVVWEWISRAIDSTSVKPPELSHLLLQLVWSKGRPRKGDLDSCITVLLRAEQLFRAKTNAPDLLSRPWQAVSWLSTVEAYRRRPASEQLFDAHVDTGNRLPGNFSVEKAHLQLLHPSHPDNEPAIELFHDKRGLRRLLVDSGSNASPLQGLAKPVPVWRSIGSWVSSLGEDTVHSLRQSGRDDEAREITRFLRMDMPELLGHISQAT